METEQAACLLDCSRSPAATFFWESETFALTLNRYKVVRAVSLDATLSATVQWVVKHELTEIHSWSTCRMRIKSWLMHPSQPSILLPSPILALCPTAHTSARSTHLRTAQRIRFITILILFDPSLDLSTEEPLGPTFP